MATVIKPPRRKKSVFLAGSIEQGKAKDWQAEIEKALEEYDVDIYNPRRDDWDDSWEQSIHSQYFKEQVEWELDHLDRANVIAMYFDENTKSPISLLELGLFASSGKMIVYCPLEFWRKGNVDVVCDRYGIRMVSSLQELIIAIKGKLS